jgi:hypothetical protein
MRYFCCDRLRPNAIRGTAHNGIEFIEVLDRDAPSEAERQRLLEVHFVNSFGGLVLSADNIRVEGGERIRGIRVENVSQAGDVLTVSVDRPGDFSPYRLRLVSGTADDTPPDGIDPELAAVEFSFKVECEVDFDCKPRRLCLPLSAPSPEIDYLAKDYASFRRLMLDRMAVLMPQWREPNPSDLGIALVEALAYVADQLSYQQDAVATESYLGTARSRISVRRHARLMDYFISEGCNARTWVYLQVGADVIGTDVNPALPEGTRVLSRIPGQAPVVEHHPDLYRLADVVFETMEPMVSLFALHNRMPFYTWSDERCCLSKGATRATLAGYYPNLEPGMVLVLEEVLGPRSGHAGDADPAHRHTVRLTEVINLAPDLSPLTDPVTTDQVTEICWLEEDALPFALCLSSLTDDEEALDEVSVARGNIVLADHGRKIGSELYTESAESLPPVPEPWLFVPTARVEDRCKRDPVDAISPRYRPGLENRPLTHTAPYDPLASARAALNWSLRAIKPAIELLENGGVNPPFWEPQRDLLNSAKNAREFVAEVENDSSVKLRFGDDVHGLRPNAGTQFATRYRIGNGTSGNVGADALTHVVANIAEVEAVRNPLSASGGRDPESIEDVRQRAPIAYRTQERAVTPPDYVAVTERHAEVQKAASTFRWTGSWHTVFVTIDREQGRPVNDEFEKVIHDHLERFRMAGYDLEVDAPRFVPLEIEMEICVAPDYFRSQVKAELLDVLSNRDLPDGRRGLFHPDHFTFGQPVYLSPVYALAQVVTGVESAHVNTFQRLDNPDPAPRDDGVLPIGRLEIARLDNDRNFRERGVLKLNIGGGK